MKTIVEGKQAMLKRFLPRQEGFFELFQKTADLLVLTATQFHILLMDAEHQQKTVDVISDYEEQADQIAYQTFALLHKTFITPFDRHDIHELTSKLDDILDLIHRCAQRFPFYHLKIVPAEIIEIGALSVQCAVLLKEALYQLNSLQKSDKIIAACLALDGLESQANALVLAGEEKLFLNENDFKQFYKLKEIYANTKQVIDSCQDAANIIKGIVLEYS
jgi:uncharacterized protein Yka (UPF0111/DUF47 family)